MTSMFRALVVALGVFGAAITADAQDPAAAKAVPLRVELVISRYQAEKKVSSVPFTFLVNATDEAPGRPQEPTRVRMGVEVPIVSYPSPAEAKQNAATGQASPVQYKPFGTNIDCFAKVLDNGQFKLSVTVEQSSPYSEQDKARLTASTNEPKAANANPVFRSYRVSSVVVLKDGQSQQFSSATDGVSGEFVKMDLTVSVAK